MSRRAIRMAHWGLSAYPVSPGYRARIEERLGGRLEIGILPEMREAGGIAFVRRLAAINADAGFVLVEYPASAPLLPNLRFLLSLTRCLTLAVVREDGTVVPFRRASGWAEAARLLYWTLRTALAALGCGIGLVLMARKRTIDRRPPPPTVRRIAYLKTHVSFGERAGGAVAHVAGVVNALTRRCDEVHVLALERPPLLDARAGFHPIRSVTTFGYPYELNYYLFHRRFVREAREVLRKLRPDVIYQRLTLGNYAGLRLARELGVPLVIEYNGSEVWVARHWGRPLRFPGLARLAEDLPLRYADLVVTVSEVLGDELAARGIQRDRIVVHPNCVDPERFDPGRYSQSDRVDLRARYGIPASAVVCGFIGTFGAWHGVILLAETIRELVARDDAWLRDRNVHFLLVGDGALISTVRDILGDSRTRPYVTLTGLMEQREAPAYLAAADVLLCPHVPNADGSRFFGSPIKLFEYMAMGKGIVASGLEQIGKVLRRSYRASQLPEGPCGEGEDRLAILITPGSREELAAGIRFLVDRPDYRAALGRNARREVLARYTWTRNVAALFQRLERLQR